ncbi:MAG: secretin N-terminal domain-containing protein [Alphaproteobacteria bacterium]|nr:secretin N-terminal domain-containing protein [Alphaproteobacteria bacterium]
MGTSADLATTNEIDPAAHLTREDYLALRQRQPPLPEQPEQLTPPPDKNAPPPIPVVTAWQAAAPEVLAPMDKPVSIVVTDNVPVRDVLMELMRKTGANLEIDPGVQGSVIIAAHEQPFGQVLRRVCMMAGLRYKTDGNFIRIEPDTPYQKTYQMDYLSLSRKTASETDIATNVFDVDVSGSGGSNGGVGGSSTNGAAATQNNSIAKLSSLSQADFWPETEKSVAQILASNGRKGSKGDFSIDRQAGMIMVYGDQQQQDAVSAYFDELRRKAYGQVLIDARIIEVELDDSYQAGIDWVAVFSHTASLAANFGPQAAPNAANFFTAEIAGSNFNALLNLVQTFGTTRVLSAPRITVLNNQTAVMKVATNQVYFVTQAQFTTTTNANGSSVTTNPVYTSTPRTVPVGLVMTVQPSIDAATNRVTMTLRPTISRVVGEVDDPSINLNAAVAGVDNPIASQIPVLAVREMDSVIQLHSGEIAVMGGLMQDSSINQDQGVPFLDDIPYVGNLFKTRDNQGKTSELVILLRATIADQPKPDKADGDLYYKYSSDPRVMDVPHSAPPPLPDLPDMSEMEPDTNPTN